MKSINFVMSLLCLGFWSYANGASKNTEFSYWTIEADEIESINKYAIKWPEVIPVQKPLRYKAQAYCTHLIGYTLAVDWEPRDQSGNFTKIYCIEIDPKLQVFGGEGAAGKGVHLLPATSATPSSSPSSTGSMSSPSTSDPKITYIRCRALSSAGSPIYGDMENVSSNVQASAKQAYRNFMATRCGGPLGGNCVHPVKCNGYDQNQNDLGPVPEKYYLMN